MTDPGKLEVRASSGLAFIPRESVEGGGGQQRLLCTSYVCRVSPPNSSQRERLGGRGWVW